MKILEHWLLKQVYMLVLDRGSGQSQDAEMAMLPEVSVRAKSHSVKGMLAVGEALVRVCKVRANT